MLILTRTAASPIPIEADGLTPDALQGQSADAIARLPVQHGNAVVPLGEFFTVQGDAGDGHLRIEGDCRTVKRLGAGMRSGLLEIHGDAGMHLGAEMRGGTIHVHGQADDWAGAEMRGGLLHVHGHTGALAGAAYRGSRLGMRGGTLLIDGNAGAEVGAGMGRGLIAVGGDADDFAGVGLIAGSVFVFGTAGMRAGANMKRGTIALFQPAELLPTFRLACTYEPTFMPVYLRQLARWNFAPACLPRAGQYRRYSGDLVSLGKGEILCWQAT